MISSRPLSLVALFASAALLVVGCGEGNDAPPRFEIKGKVTFAGKPVPYGEILFQPDSAKNNSGPGALGQIKDGQYSIAAEKGVTSGPQIVRISGFDRPPSANIADDAATPLFEGYETEVDLPKEATTNDFEVPAQ